MAGARGTKLSPADLELAEFVAQFYGDPLGFVRACYPWREPGTALEHWDGPDTWQEEFLARIGEKVRANAFNGVDPVEPVRGAVSSGHGTGKSAMVAWLVDWIMSTRPHCQGTVTANTITQLKTKTWPAIQHWTGLCLTAHWFRLNSERMYHPDFPESWFVARQSSKEQNSEAFAGQHAASSTSFYINDEDSAVPDKIHEVEEGGLTDGEPFQFLFGNPTRNTGAFFNATHGKLRSRYIVRVVDSRTSKIANKSLIGQWLQDHGEDSDFFRVRVRGLPPRADELQYIDSGRVDAARARTPHHFADDPLVAGFDVSGGGKAWNVIRFRRGLNGKPRDPIRLSGEKDPDRNQRVAICAELLRDQRPEHRLAALFVDSAFGAPIVARLHALGFDNVFEVNFGGDSPDRHCHNMRAYMYAGAKDWLLRGTLPDEELLAEQLTAPGYHIDKQGRLVIEPKEQVLERVECMDDSDAFVLTFAMPVALPAAHQSIGEHRPPRSAWG
jgi:hypothetical protein